MSALDEVHVLIRNYCTDEGAWETVLAICADETDANLRALALNEAETNPDASYHAQSYPVLAMGEQVVFQANYGLPLPCV